MRRKKRQLDTLSPLALGFIDIALTANDTYSAYQEGDMAPAGSEFAFAMGVSRIPGGKLATKVGSKFTKNTKNGTEIVRKLGCCVEVERGPTMLLIFLILVR